MGPCSLHLPIILTMGLVLEDKSWVPAKVRGATASTEHQNLTCFYSAFWRFNEHTLAMEMIAFRDINRGEEITFSCKTPCPPDRVCTHWP